MLRQKTSRFLAGGIEKAAALRRMARPESHKGWRSDHKLCNFYWGEKNEALRPAGGTRGMVAGRRPWIGVAETGFDVFFFKDQWVDNPDSPRLSGGIFGRRPTV
jgi:hypothetical protein